jgi:hypothetical protein
MTGSRLVYDHQGPRFCIGADGCVWRVLHLAAVMGFEPPGRLPEAREMLMTRSTYTSVVGARRDRQRQVVPDDELDERAALEACRREQQREPADLIGRVAV